MKKVKIIFEVKMTEEGFNDPQFQETLDDVQGEKGKEIFDNTPGVVGVSVKVEVKDA